MHMQFSIAGACAIVALMAYIGTQHIVQSQHK